MRALIALLTVAVLGLAIAVVALYQRHDDGQRSISQVEPAVGASPGAVVDPIADRIRALEQRIESLTAELEALRSERRSVPVEPAVLPTSQLAVPVGDDAFLAEHRDAILKVIDDDARRRAFEEESKVLRAQVRVVAEHYHWDVATLMPIVVDYRRRMFDLEWRYCPQGMAPEKGTVERQEYDQGGADALSDYNAAMGSHFGPSAARDVLINLATHSWPENR